MIRQYTRPIALTAAAAFIVFHTVMIAALFRSLSFSQEQTVSFSAAASPSGSEASFFWSEAKHTPTHDRKPAVTIAVCLPPIPIPKIQSLRFFFPEIPVMLKSPESTPSSQRDPPAVFS